MTEYEKYLYLTKNIEHIKKINNLKNDKELLVVIDEARNEGFEDKEILDFLIDSNQRKESYKNGSIKLHLKRKGEKNYE